MRFYLPNFEDLVDPEFDFETDSYSPRRKDRWVHDWYAHQFFDEPIFDGMLISKAIVKPVVERHIRKAGGGVHQFARLSPRVPIMGDCGAFTYLYEEKPVYSTQEVLDYYHEFGFDYGVSLDHLAFVTVGMLESALKRGAVKTRWWTGKTDEQLRQKRIDLTLRNAREFLALCEKERPRFKPIGIAQGGTPELFYDSVQQLIAMGYDHVALGGLVKSTDEEILAILREIQPLLGSVKLHIFGVARLSLVPEFIRLGVTSTDSAAPLRRAFLGTAEDNYWTLDGHRYAAIRVPHARTERNRRGVDSPEEILRNGEMSQATLVGMEQRALRLLRAFDQGQATLDQTLDAVLTYDRLHGIERDYESAYRRTLQDKPWKNCDCPICKRSGIEVIIFRGNNRNRRRGFHNVKVFYDQFRRAAQRSPDTDTLSRQLPLELE